MFTGKLSMTRNEAQTLAIEAGGIAGKSVNGSTDYLVVGGSPGSKLQKAATLMVTVLSEADFNEYLQQLPEEELPMEEWTTNGISIIPGRVFESLLIKLEARAHEKDTRILHSSNKEEEGNIIYNRNGACIEGPSYLDLFKLSDLLANYQESTPINREPKVCRRCGDVIPYSTHPKRHYCFGCHTYEDAIKPAHKFLPLKFQPHPDEVLTYCRCCGRLVTLPTCVFNKNVEIVGASDYVNSVEFVASESEFLTKSGADIPDSVDIRTEFTQQELANLRDLFRNQGQRKVRNLQKSQQKRQERKNKRPSQTPLIL